MKKKILSTALLLAASATLFAQTAPVKAEQFSSFGTNWVEVDLGATVYSARAGDSDQLKIDEAGFSADIKGNLVIIGSDSKDFFGLDLEAVFAYRNLDRSMNISGVAADIKADVDTYSYSLELKPYLRLLDTENLALKVFANPFISYLNVDTKISVSAGGQSNSIAFGQDALCYGMKVGFEISFLEDFYIMPAYRYLRVEPTGMVGEYLEQANLHIAELEIGYKVSESLSLHLSYAYTLLGDTPSFLSVYMNKIMLGVRYGF